MSAALVAALAGPAVLAVVTVVTFFAFGALPALAVLAAGAAALLGFHLWHLDKLARWASAPLGAAVPEGYGCWRIAFSDLHRRARTRLAYQRDLAQTIERFASAAQAIPDGMVVLDRDDRIRWSNPSAQALLGLDPKRDVGAPIANLARQPEFVGYLDRGDYSDAVTITSQRDAPLTLSLQIVPFGAEEKLLIARDITRLDAVARMRRDFIANVSHELKTPLTVVAGFLETMQDLELEPRQRERYLALMAEQARSMQRLVDDLLTLSALESEQNAPSESEFAVAPLVLGLSADAKALSGGHHRIAVDLADAAMVVGSRDELASAFGNLVSNAVRYTPDGGTITLEWRVEADGTGVFAVTDSGIGIAPEHLPRLTERFYRVDRSRSRASGGTGLGLAIVKHVLLRHQSELAVDSEPGRGSTFSVRLPPRRVRRAAPPGDDGGVASAGLAAAGRDSVPAAASAAPPAAAGSTATRR
jgi:two-component system phosphate regulon sensor histidine kinase PhoR